MLLFLVHNLRFLDILFVYVLVINKLFQNVLFAFLKTWMVLFWWTRVCELKGGDHI